MQRVHNVMQASDRQPVYEDRDSSEPVLQAKNDI